MTRIDEIQMAVGIGFVIALLTLLMVRITLYVGCE